MCAFVLISACIPEQSMARESASGLHLGSHSLRCVGWVQIILYEQVNGDMDPAKIFMSVAFFEFLNMR